MRKYKKVILHSGDAVMFLMENGWYYITSPTDDRIGVFKDPAFYVTFNPYVEEGAPPKDVLDKAVKALNKLPVVNGLTQKKLDETQQNTFKWPEIEE